jgi:hypothetical protein
VSTQVGVAVALCCLFLAGVVEDGCGVALEALELIGALVGSVGTLGGAALVVGVAGAGTGLCVALVLRLGRLTADILVGSCVEGLFDALISLRFVRFWQMSPGGYCSALE